MKQEPADWRGRHCSGCCTHRGNPNRTKAKAGTAHPASFRGLWLHCSIICKTAGKPSGLVPPQVHSACGGATGASLAVSWKRLEQPEGAPLPSLPPHTPPSHFPNPALPPRERQIQAAAATRAMSDAAVLAAMKHGPQHSLHTSCCTAAAPLHALGWSPANLLG